jgi:hypothetical protein
MNLKRFNSLLRLPVLLVIAHASPAIAQDAPPKTTAEIRALVAKSRSKDLKTSDDAKQALSKLDAKSLPALVSILNKGKPCEQVVAAQLIVELDPKDPNIVPVMTKVTRGGSVWSNEEEMMCRRAAAYVLVFSAEGIRVLTHLLKEGDLFERRSAIFAFDDLTETSNYPEGILTAMKEAIAEIAKATKEKDQVLSEMADEVLAQIARGANLELGALAKKYIAANP